MSERSVGRHLCDVFHLVPAGSDPGLRRRDARRRRARERRRRPPQSSFDLAGLAAHRDRFPVPVLVSSPDTIRRSNDKAETYALLQRLGREGARLPPGERRRRGRGGGARARLSRPPVCFKPVFSSGSRGFRILDPIVDRARQLCTSVPLGGDAARGSRRAVTRGGRARPARDGLATGGERTIDGIADGKRVVLGHPKTREAMRAGLAMYFVTLEDEELMATATGSSPSSRSSGSSTSSSSAST